MLWNRFCQRCFQGSQHIPILIQICIISFRECAVTVSVPLPNLNLSRAAEGRLIETALVEWLLRPLQALASIRPTAELYRLKRKFMDSPFRRELDEYCNLTFPYQSYNMNIFTWNHLCKTLSLFIDILGEKKKVVKGSLKRMISH